MHMFKLNNAFAAGHCRCKLDGSELVFFQGEAVETFECPEALKKYFQVIPEMYAVVNEDGETGEITAEPCPWVNLHIHTEYSLLDGAIKAPDLAKKLTPDGSFEYSPICAITDHGNMFGTYAFSKALRDAKEKPIIGCEVYCQGTNGQNENNHLILLCKNKTGYQNLCKILTEAENNFYRHANVTIDNLRKYSEGLIALSACLAGELARQILADNEDKAEEFIETMIDIFGDDFYVELQNHNLVEEMRVRRVLVKLAKEFGLKTVATTDSHYLNKEDAGAHEVLLCIGTGKKINDPSRFKFEGDGYYILSNDEAYERFKMYPEAIANQVEIAEKCEFYFKDTKVTMPEFDVPEGYTETEYFEMLVRKGFEERFADKDIDRKAYTERMEYELSTMEKMGFEGYFLIVQDFINWAKEHGIAIGPGRGSCVGSLVAYCLKITDLDPIPLELLFEREKECVR